MGNNKKHRKRNNYPVKQQQATKARNEPADTLQPPIALSLLNTVDDSTAQSSIDAFNLLSEINFGNDRSMQENSDMIYRISNVPVPRLWRGRFIASALESMKARAKVSGERQQEIMDRLSAIVAQNPKTAEFIDAINNWIFNDDQDALFNSFTPKELKKIDEFIPLDSEGITFCHGTSYENYMQIKADGVIRRTDYSDYVDKRSKNRERHFRNNSGYVYLSDSIDKPLSFSFGGYRNSLLNYEDEEKRKSPKVSFAKQEGARLRKENIGVIFEIVPKGYNVFFAAMESDFVVDSDIPLTDIDNVRFFYADNNFQIEEITEQEIEERGIE